jgi:transmembrane sensor
VNKATLLYLLDKFKQGLCTEEEQQLLYRWLDQLEQEAPEETLFTAEEKQQVKSSMLQHIVLATAPSRGRPVLRLRWVQVAAAITVLAGITYLLRLQLTPKQPRWLTHQNNSMGVQRLLLPDSSLVMLGAHTTLQYTRSGRTIKLLQGKAFFDVRTNPQQPFTVESNGIHTTVLGTSFSVAAYKQLYACRVTVITGKVQVHNYGILTPAQRITIPSAQKAALRDSIALPDALAWTSGTIVLRNASLQELLSMLQEQYGITPHTQLNTQQGNYTLRLQAAMPLQQVLTIIEKISYKPKIRFRMQQEQLTVY